MRTTRDGGTNSQAQLSTRMCSHHQGLEKRSQSYNPTISMAPGLSLFSNWHKIVPSSKLSLKVSSEASSGKFRLGSCSFNHLTVPIKKQICKGGKSDYLGLCIETNKERVKHPENKGGEIIVLLLTVLLKLSVCWLSPLQNSLLKFDPPFECTFNGRSIARAWSMLSYGSQLTENHSIASHAILENTAAGYI